jgi:hypothetical protein
MNPLLLQSALEQQGALKVLQGLLKDRWNSSSRRSHLSPLMRRQMRWNSSADAETDAMEQPVSRRSHLSPLPSLYLPSSRDTCRQALQRLLYLLLPLLLWGRRQRQKEHQRQHQQKASRELSQQQQVQWILSF